MTASVSEGSSLVSTRVAYKTGFITKGPAGLLLAQLHN